VPYTVAIAEDKDMLALLKPYQEFGQQKLHVEMWLYRWRLEGDRAYVRKPASMGAC
jgi:5'-nucleotidase/UDP-sugar diphosphatase